MSLIGIDVGSTGAKISAYNQEGKSLGSIYAAHTPQQPFPGAWELDPEEVWNAVDPLRRLTAAKSVKVTPPRAIVNLQIEDGASMLEYCDGIEE